MIYIFRVIVILLWFGCTIQSYAQSVPATFEMSLPGVTSYSEAIPTPSDVIGHTIGERHTIPHQLVDYFAAVAEASDRVVLRNHGMTYENRPLVHAIVTSPANHDRLEEIRTQNLRLSDTPNDVSDADLAGMPVVVYQGYSIHGNEASGSEASLLYLYHLAAGEGPAIDEILENTVVIVDPSFNPDGRDRFTDWANRNRGRAHTSDPQDREHIEPWPGGRTNHYWFDLNRDWLPAQHPESQGRLEIFHTWRPQMLTDHHEMGTNSTFFFMPGIPSRNNPLTPPRNYELTAAVAEYHAEWLDSIGTLYYSKESFDDFYYGKGSTFPDVNGAIGILFEQASSRALERESQYGNLHYGITVQNQFTASLSTAEAAVNLREELLAHQRDFYASASEVAREGPVRAYVVSLERDRTRSQAFAQMMQRHRIQLYELDRDIETDGVLFQAGEAYVVPVDQQQARLVKTMFERATSFQDSLFYDVSTWTMPLAFDVDYGEIRANFGQYLGQLMEPVVFDGGERIGGTSEYGYVMPWGPYFAPRALYRLQAAGFYPRLLNHDFEVSVGGAPRQLPRGSIFIPAVHRDLSLQHLGEKLEELIDQIVAEDHVVVYALDTGFSTDGPDLGTGTASVLNIPKIALLTGSGASGYRAGEVWHLLSERFQIPITLLDIDRVSRSDLSRYNTIVMAGGGYNGLPADDIKSWVQEGGRLIALASGADWTIRQDFLELDRKSFDMDSLLKDVPYDQLGRTRGAQFIGGSIFEAQLDTTHPLAYGFRETIPLFRTSNTFYEPSNEPGELVARYTESPLMSGYISEERLEMMPGSSALVAAGLGQGKVIAFMDNPNFRAFWYGSNGLFMNAVFFGGSL